MKTVVVVNENDEVIGTMEREEAHRNGTPHRIVVVYVENPAGQILVQVRMSGRIDHSSAGHVDLGEEYLDTARRELNEELGINNIELIFVGKGVSREVVVDKRESRTHVFQVFKCVAEPKILQSDEIKSVYWANPKGVLKQMQENPNDMKFTGQFRSSLPIYLKFCATIDL